jgi:hypothetical protein
MTRVCRRDKNVFRSKLGLEQTDLKISTPTRLEVVCQSILHSGRRISGVYNEDNLGHRPDAFMSRTGRKAADESNPSWITSTELIGENLAMPDVAQVLEAQQRVAREVAACVTDLQDGSWDAREWERIAIDVEIETSGGRRISAQTSVIARRPGQPFEDLDFRLSMRAKDALIALREAMRDDRGAWSTCRLRMDRDGRFEFDFSYEPPRRLGGDLLYSPLLGHLDRYLDETGKR